MSQAAQPERRLSLVEFIEQRDFALERCALLRAEVDARDAKLTKITADFEELKKIVEKLSAKPEGQSA